MGDDDPWGQDPDWFADLDRPDGYSDDEGGDGDDDEQGGDGSGMNKFPGAQHCLMLVDMGCPGLWEERFPDPDDSGLSDFLVSMADLVWRAAEQMVRHKIRTTMALHTAKRDAMGLVLYNTRSRTPIPLAAALVDNNNEEEDEKDAEPEKTKDKQEDDDNDSDTDDEMGGQGAPPTTVHDIIPLRPPGIATVKHLRGLQDDPIVGRLRDLQAEYGEETTAQSTGANNNNDDDGTSSTDANPFHAAFQHAVQIYKTSKSVKKVKEGELQDVRQVWIFTSNDDPLAGNDDLLRIVKTTVQEAVEDGISLVVFALPKLQTDGSTAAAAPFDYSLFYEPIGAEAADMPEPTTSASSSDISEPLLDLTSMQAQWMTVRRSLTVPLLLPDWRDNLPDRPGIALDLYRLVQERRIPPKVVIHNETGRMLSRITQVVPKDGGGEVLEESRRGATSSTSTVTKPRQPERDRYFAVLGRDQVPLSLQDKADLMKAANANPDFGCLVLLGFRRNNDNNGRKAAIPWHHCLEPAFFAYPSDERTAGSAAAFSHLHASMLRKQVLAMGELLTRATGTSRLVAIYPLEEETEAIENDDDDDDDNDDMVVEQTRPAGLLIVPLPFEDDMRALEPDAAVEALQQQPNEEGTDLATEEVVQAAEKLIQKQTITDFEIGVTLENARLDKYWNYAEHLALNLPLTRRKEGYDTIPDEDELRKLLGPDADAFAASLPEDIKPEPSKKRKLVPDEATGELDWGMIYREQLLEQVRNDDLKKKLKSLGEKVGGKKQDLVERLLPHLAEEFDTVVKEEPQEEEEQEPPQGDNSGSESDVVMKDEPDNDRSP